MFWRKKPIIIHAHMFKNAGSSLDWSLARCFKDGFLDHRDNDSMMEGGDYLQTYLKENKHIQALSSHWINFPLPKMSGLRIFSILIFRHPIERIRSVYKFERKQEPAETPGSIKAKELCFRDYVDWQMNPMPGPAIKDYQTRYCSGTYLGDDLKNKFQLAQNTLSKTPLIGLVDCYDESMLLFEDQLRPYFPQIDLSYVRQNITQSNKLTQSQRIEQTLDELGPVADKVLEKNHFDLLLYKQAESIFKKRLQGIKNQSTRLDRFRAHCQNLVDIHNGTSS